MPEHRIRLRGGWEFQVTGGSPWLPRQTLPLIAFPDGPGPVRLARNFQTPPMDAGSETLWLRLDAVPGLLSVVLNDRVLARGPFDKPVLDLTVGDALRPRNRLVLDVQPPAKSDSPFGVFPWGDVALVITHGLEPSDPDAAP